MIVISLSAAFVFSPILTIMISQAERRFPNVDKDSLYQILSGK